MSISIPKRIDTRFRGGMAAVEEIDRRSLAADLRTAIEGEVRFDTGSRALYATDASNYRMPPIGVVIPRHVDELVEIHRVCREHGAPIVLRGGGTSLAGQGCNTAVLIDFSKYLHHIVEIDPDRRLARVQPGCVLDHLRGVAAEKYGLTFGPDPSTHAYCTIGGMLGNNSCGRHSVQSEFHGPGPRMADNLVELEVLTYRGERLRIGPGGVGTPDDIAARLHALADANAEEILARYPQIPRRVSGYNLDELLPEKGFEVARSLVGTESTCVTVLEATLELIPKPKCVSLLVVAYPDKYRTADHVMIARDHQPISIEGMDDTLIQDMTVLGLHERERSQLPGGGGWLFVEFGGDTKDEADEKARSLRPEGHVCCGRPLYDYGFLDLAERYLRRNLEQLKGWYREGVPIVGLEPSCVAVFKDELGKLIPSNDDATRLETCFFHFAEFFQEFDIEPPPLMGKAFVWGHCHHKATGGIDPEVELLQKMGVEVDTLNAGCCGLAGSWGFEAGHHEVSMQCGEQGLLPRVRELDDDTLVVADGFSCKTQIEEGETGRRALHIAQVLQLAHEHGPGGPRGAKPERLYYGVKPKPSHRRRAIRAAAAVAVLAGVATLLRRQAP